MLTRIIPAFVAGAIAAFVATVSIDLPRRGDELKADQARKNRELADEAKRQFKRSQRETATHAIKAIVLEDKQAVLDAEAVAESKRLRYSAEGAVELSQQ